MRFFVGFVAMITIAALIGMGLISSQAAYVSAQANLAQGTANAAANGAILQAQCLAGMVGFLGLAAGIPLGIFLYSRHQHEQQAKLVQEQMRMRALRQPRHSNGRFSQGVLRNRSGLHIPESYLPQGAQPYIILMPSPQQRDLTQVHNQQTTGEMFILEDGADDELDLWGF